jgi:hypothetical protein
VKERPIIFSAPMVRAILAGSKTQTRRKWKMPRGCEWYAEMGGEQQGWFVDPDCPWWLHVNECRCPYGQAGDRLWVRETHALQNRYHNVWCTYAADGHRQAVPAPEFVDVARPGMRPSIHMPRWASRITLEVTGIRVERLQDISHIDAVAEGCSTGSWTIAEGPRPEEPFGSNAVKRYRLLWESINGPGSWDANPWVWVVEFRKVQP